MKLGTLRFSPKHRAARARMAQRDYYRGSQWHPFLLKAGRTTVEAIKLNRIHTAHRWWMAAEPGTFGVMHESTVRPPTNPVANQV